MLERFKWWVKDAASIRRAEELARQAEVTTEEYLQVCNDKRTAEKLHQLIELAASRDAAGYRQKAKSLSTAERVVFDELFANLDLGLIPGPKEKKG